jgi:hypothetical protein
LIYLSGRLSVEQIGNRLDIGIMLGYRAGSLSHGKRHLEKALWAADNGCYTNPDLDVNEYFEWLQCLSKYQETCLFATAPDVVGDAIQTWERSKRVLPLIRELGYPAALVAQDGIEHCARIEWDSFDCLFIGGTTEWKLSGDAFSVIKQALARGKWVHMGRVNSFRRMLRARYYGCHSTDGTQLAFAPDKRLVQLEKWLDFIRHQPVLGGVQT